MKLTFRWYGPNDPVTLEQISQIPTMSGIVSAVYDVAPGGVWRDESIAAIKSAAAAHRLAFEVVESVPVAEDIKLGTAKAPAMIDAYCENVRRLGRAGVKCICYNFMPVFGISQLSPPKHTRNFYLISFFNKGSSLLYFRKKIVVINIRF